MHLVEAVLFLMALVIISNVLSHYIVAVPVSLIQVALGLGAALFFHLTINLATDWFMLLFIAPLLFYDGRHFHGENYGSCVVRLWGTPFFWCLQRCWSEVT